MQIFKKYLPCKMIDGTVKKELRGYYFNAVVTIANSTCIQF